MPIRNPGSRYYSPRSRLAQQLMQQGLDTSPIQHWTQGLARMGQAGIGAFLQHRDQADQQAATQAMLEGFQPQPAPGDIPETVPGGYGAATENLGQLGSNPYASRLANQLQMQKIGVDQKASIASLQRRQALADFERNRTNQLADLESGRTHDRETQLAMRQLGLLDKRDLADYTAGLRADAARRKPYDELGLTAPPAEGAQNALQSPQAVAGTPAALPGAGAPGGPEALAAARAEMARQEAQAKAQGAAAVKQQQAMPKDVAALNQLEFKVKTIISTIDKAMDLAAPTDPETGERSPNPWATGYGTYLEGMPNSDAGMLRNYLDTIRANVGFDTLQQMRDNSKTGGALGQVSEMENRLLQAVHGALDPKQADQLIENLEVIRALYPRVLQEKRDAFSAAYGEGGAPGGQGAPAEAPQPASQFSPEDVEALNWAKQNPNDPRAAQILQSLGLGGR